MQVLISEKEKVRLEIEKAQAGDEKALSDLVKNNIALVKSIAKRFTDRGVEFDDLVQLGSIGLIKAIRGFDLSYDTTLSTYAVPLICGEIKRFLRDDGIIKASRSVKKNSKDIANFISSYEMEKGESPTIDEIAKNIGISVEDVTVAMSYSYPVNSLYYENDDGESVPIDISDDSFENDIDSVALNMAFEKLSREERTLVNLRFRRGLTQSKTAEIMGLTQVKVSRWEKKICNKLKTMLSEA